jgi:hypothetical protein
MQTLLEAKASAESAPLSTIIRGGNRNKIPGINAILSSSQRATLGHVATALPSTVGPNAAQHIFPLFFITNGKPTLAGFAVHDKDSSTLAALSLAEFEPAELTENGEYRFDIHALNTLAQKGNEIERMAAMGRYNKP